jgi:hypothetical protein
VPAAYSDKGKGKVLLQSFITVVENGIMPKDEVTAKFLAGHSRPEVMAAVLGATSSLAPAAARFAAAHRLTGDASGSGNVGDGACAAAPDAGLAKVLGAYGKVCTLDASFKASLNDVVLSQKLVVPESLRGCGACEGKFKAAAVGAIEAYRERGEDALSNRDVYSAFHDLCEPVLDALLDECGSNRQGVSALKIARE